MSSPKQFISTLFVAMALLTSGAALANPAPAIVGGQVLVKLHAVATQPAATRLEPSTLGRTLGRIEARSRVRLTLVRPLHFGWALFALGDPRRPATGASDTWQALDRLRRDPAVAAADAVHLLRAAAVPTDPLHDRSWHWEAINAEAAWDLSTGAAAQRVGVMDTGLMRLHEDLREKDLGGYDFISAADGAGDGDGRDADYSDPMAVSECDGEPVDLLSHGTHVSGIVAASANNGLGTAGLNWQAGIVTARIFGACGEGQSADLLDAMAWLSGYPVDGVTPLAAPVAVINLSLGGDYPCGAGDALADYLDNIYAQRHVIFVAATGNKGNGQAVEAPASCPGVIAVAAHGPGEQRPLTAYSNFNGKVDVVAPGGDLSLGEEGGILSACGDADDCYQYAQGTSMATPVVAGAVSLMLALKPDLSFDQIVEILQGTGVSCEGCGSAKALDLAAALTLTQDTATEPPVVDHGSCGGLACGPGGLCDDGFTCIVNDDGDKCCQQLCDPVEGMAACDRTERCNTLSSGGGVCMPGGTKVEGEGCDGDPAVCRADHVCAGYQGKKVCLRRCDDGSPCRSASATCQAAGDYKICSPPLSPEEAKTQELCDPARGHWDCDEGFGCVAWEAVEEGGVCALGAQGNTYTGYTCEAAVDCESGLCEKGVCAMPCDEAGACPEPFTCEADAIPGGLCSPKACSSSDDCGEGFACTTTPSGDKVCAMGGCGCAADRATAAEATLALMALGLLATRRRRHA